MTSPHAAVKKILADNLPKTWKIRTGDRPLDGQITAPTCVLYTTSVDNKTSIRAGHTVTELKLIVLTPEGNPDTLEDRQFNALCSVLHVLNKHQSTLTWSTATRGAWSNYPGYEIEIKIAMHIKEL